MSSNRVEFSASQRTVVEMLRRQVAARDKVIRELRIQLNAIAQALETAAGVKVARVHMIEPDPTLVALENERIEGVAEGERVVMLGDIPGAVVVGMDGQIHLPDGITTTTAAKAFWRKVGQYDPEKLRARATYWERKFDEVRLEVERLSRDVKRLDRENEDLARDKMRLKRELENRP